MKLRITAVCNIGVVRDTNEDMVLVGKKIIRDEVAHEVISLDRHALPYIVAVADGMGGANAGEVASRVVLEMLKDGISALQVELDDAALRAEIKRLCMNMHRHLLQMGAIDQSKSGMGTTLAALLVYHGKMFIFWAGDSRIYRYRDATLKQITRDHSISELMSLNKATSHQIYNSIGGGSDSYIEFERSAGKILNEDVFLLCSDGLSDVIGHDELEAILGEKGREEALIKTAIKKGSQDNITYLLLELSESESIEIDKYNNCH